MKTLDELVPWYTLTFVCWPGRFGIPIVIFPPPTKWPPIVWEKCACK